MWDAKHYKIEEVFNVDGGGGEKLMEAELEQVVSLVC